MAWKIPALLCFMIFTLGIVNGSKDEVGIHELNKGNFSIKVTNYGARIVSVILPDKNGKLGDIVLGYDTVKEYMNDSAYFGAVVGRVANRIAGAQFSINGTHYKLDANEGANTLHGGRKGLSQVFWKVKKYENSGRTPYITLTYTSPDGEEGFPGALRVTVTYSLLTSDKMRISMKAKALDKATPVNLAQHSYWNLGGHDSGDILSDEVRIFASNFTPVDKHLIPTGEIKPVQGTPYDFLKIHEVKNQINQLPIGYDINYVLDEHKYKMRPVAVVHSKKSGRVMEMFTNAPGVQFYTGNFIKNIKGKGGHVYQAHAALCLETQGFPDAVNHPNFPSQIVLPGKTSVHYMLLTFSTQKE